jgi:HPt (histidine-containing phosphotransfer) domain-containing protein
MPEPELLRMLAAEAERRAPEIAAGVEGLARSGDADPARVEELRVEAHGLKGAAMVVGQPRLAELAGLIEIALAKRTEAGRIEPELAAALATGVIALRNGARAAAAEEPEPPSVAEAMTMLSDA